MGSVASLQILAHVLLPLSGALCAWSNMLKESLVVYILWLLSLCMLSIAAFLFQISWLLILAGIACLIVPADRTRHYIVKKHPELLPSKHAWIVVFSMLVAPTSFGLWYAFQVTPSAEVHPANIVVIWLLSFFIFPLCTYSYWFFNKSSWQKLHAKVTGK